MFRNYLKVAIRNLFKDKQFSLINLTGLSVGTAVVILIMLFVTHEWSYDQFHDKSDRIHRAWVKEHFKGELIFNSVTPLLLGDELRNNFPEIQAATRYMNGRSIVRQGELSEEESVYFVDPAFFQLFDFELLRGQRDQVFDQLRQVVITQEMGWKYFGEPNPVGKTLSVELGEEWAEFLVSGIIEEAPNNSSIQYEILLPFDNAEVFFSEQALSCWTCVYGETYVLVDEKTNLEALDAKIAPFIDEQVSESYAAGEYIVGLQPLTDIHLNNDIPAGLVAVSDGRYPYILASVAFLILLLGCINFTTLSVGRSVVRAKEVGVRKVAGATRWHLRAQFWSEAILMALFAMVVGLVLAKVLLPAFNELAGTELVLTMSLGNVLVLLALAVLIGLLSGVYPALVLSGFAPLQAIHGLLAKSGRNKHLVLRGLVGFQFVLSIALIICTLGMQKQLTFLQNKSLGFDRDLNLIVPYNGTGGGLSDTWEDAYGLQERFRNELSSKGVEEVLLSGHTFGTSGWTQVGYTDPETDEFRQFNVQQVDYEYLESMGIELVAGRYFDQEMGTDEKAVVVNETFAKTWQLDDPLEERLPEPFQEYQIIGVAKDFHFSSLHTAISPLVMSTNFIPLLQAAPDRNFGDFPTPKFSFQFTSDELPTKLTTIQKAWETAIPELPFDFAFMDDNLDRQYRSEQQLSQILGLATILAIFIACLGLFGIATLTINQRTREIGIRKVLGASTGQIVVMLNKNFTLLAFGATLIAAPIAWYFVKQWMQDFAYQTPISWGLFALAGLAAIALAVFSVSYQSIRAAIANPVESLRRE